MKQITHNILHSMTARTVRSNTVQSKLSKRGTVHDCTVTALYSTYVSVSHLVTYSTCICLHRTVMLKVVTIATIMPMNKCFKCRKP